MALLLLLVLVTLTWGLGALTLWPRARWFGEVLPWLGGTLALGVVACLAWGFVGILRYADWQALSTAQAVHRMFGDGNLWFHLTGWPLLDRLANVYLTLDVAWTLLALCAASLRGWVFWAGVAERRRQARVRRGR